MNREIEFRGKVKRPDGVFVSCTDKNDGEWVFGDLEVRRKDGRVLIHIYNADGGYYRQYDVDPDTVGQFTGMTDKHGVKVFEGDIVDVYDFTSVYASKYRGVVKMYGGSWCVEYEDSIFDMVAHPKLFFDDFADRKTEVISNIYDTTELLAAK